MPFDFVLVHGYTGSPRDLLPIYEALVKEFPADVVTNLCLPGHDASAKPPFEKSLFLESIDAAVATSLKNKRKVILLGHSTGGSLILSYLAEYSFKPHFVILASVPKRIDGTYLERWNRHSVASAATSASAAQIPLTQIARMVSEINKAGMLKQRGEFPVLLLHGSNDELVPVQEAYLWAREGFSAPARLAVIPGGDHDLFHGTNSALAVDMVKRCLADAVAVGSEGNTMNAEATLIGQSEEELHRFLTLSPQSYRHLASCPSGQRLLGSIPKLDAIPENEPVFANLEVTTRCNLHCQFCARTLWGEEVITRKYRDMPVEEFRYILGLLPHAYRLTLVGLGEPLLHPRIVDLVAEASSRGRRIGIVTNATCLDKSLSLALIQAGLNTMAFSLDAASQLPADKVRFGSDPAKIMANIKDFIEIKKNHPSVSTAVFCALSVHTLPWLEELIDNVAGLGVDAIMLTDLNFKPNLSETLWKNSSDHSISTVRKAIGRAFANKLPVLSVLALEEFGLASRYRDFLLLSPKGLFQRSALHTHCFSPWQTMPVNLDGDVTICDCQPNHTLGNLLNRPLSEIWNGQIMVEHRRRMLGPNPPEDCRICPRF